MGLKERLLGSAKVQNALEQGWQVHARMFREIMEPAFVGDDAARLELVAALNMISRGDCAKGIKKLGGMDRYVKTDEDELVILFFLGLACERAGAYDKAIELWSRALEYEPDFYLIYNMLGQLLLRKNEFDGAMVNFSSALDCLEDEEKRDEIPAVNRKQLLASIYGNMAHALLKMGNYADAEWALYESEKYIAVQPKLLTTWAFLYAVTERKQQALECFDKLRCHDPVTAEAVKPALDDALSGKDGRFAVQKDAVQNSDYASFWKWLAENSQQLLVDLSSEDGSDAVDSIYASLAEVFPFTDVTAEFSLRLEGRKRVIEFYDNYHATLHAGLEQLIKRAPEALLEDWVFDIVH